MFPKFVARDLLAHFIVASHEVLVVNIKTDGETSCVVEIFNRNTASFVLGSPQTPIKHKIDEISSAALKHITRIKSDIYGYSLSPTAQDKLSTEMDLAYAIANQINFSVSIARIEHLVSERLHREGLINETGQPLSFERRPLPRGFIDRTAIFELK